MSKLYLVVVVIGLCIVLNGCQTKCYSDGRCVSRTTVLILPSVTIDSPGPTASFVPPIYKGKNFRRSDQEIDE